MKILRRSLSIFILLLVGPLVSALGGCARLAGDWTVASREPAGIAPDPKVTRAAVVQVYAARAFKWRGAFAVHTWIAVKPEAAPGYTVYQVIGWAVRHGGRAINIEEDVPDRYWYGARPELLAELRGRAATRAIAKIRTIVADYPYPMSYRTWPGPNSNTFTAYVLRRVPELAADLPPTAIGKDFLPGPGFFAHTPSGGGAQVSLLGLAGVLISVEEGLEVNLLGLSFGIDPGELALRLPGIGKVGLNIHNAAARDRRTVSRAAPSTP